MAQGFSWAFNLYGGRALVEVYVMQDTETLTKGDLLSAQTNGRVDLAATNDADLLGLMQGPHNPADGTVGNPGVVAGTTAVTRVQVLTSPDAVYEDVDDTSARDPAVTLDISGATGAMALATSSNADVRVIGRKEQAADPTRFMIIPGEHAYL